MKLTLSSGLTAIVAYVVAVPLCDAQIAAPTTAPAPPVITQPVTSGDASRPAANANNVQLTATSTSNLASVTLGDKLAPALIEGWNWSIMLSSPITMGSDSSGGSSTTNTQIATLDGLANGFSATLKVFRFDMIGLGNGPDSDKDPIVAKARQACKDKGKVSADACGKLSPDLAVQQYDPDDLPDYLAPFFPGQYGVRALTYGLQSRVGYNAFTFYTAKTLAKSSQDDEPWSAGGYLGLMPATSLHYPTLVTFAANYQNAFTAQPSSTMCLNKGGGIDCQTGSFGAPKSAEKLLLSLSSNTLIDIAGYNVGLGPQLTYDAKSGVTGVDFPIYFITGASGGLTAGLSFGWTSDKHDFIVGFLVGVPFNVFASQ